MNFFTQYKEPIITSILWNMIFIFVTTFVVIYLWGSPNAPIVMALAVIQAAYLFFGYLFVKKFEKNPSLNRWILLLIAVGPELLRLADALR